MYSKQEIEELYSSPGEVRGVVLRTDADYIKAVKGLEGLRQVEQKIQEWGHPVRYSEVQATSWIPSGFRFLSILAAKECFQWKEKDIFKMGYEAPQHSLMVKILMKYFLNFEKTYQKSTEYWKTHYTIGNLETTEFNAEKEYFKLRLQDFPLREELCAYYAGYFFRIAQLASPYKDVNIQTTSCPQKEEKEYYEYQVTWKKDA